MLIVVGFGIPIALIILGAFLWLKNKAPLDGTTSYARLSGIILGIVGLLYLIYLIFINSGVL